MLLFRSARPAPVSWNLAKTLLQIIAFWGTFLFLAPRVPLAVTDGWWRFTPHRFASWTLFAVASYLGLASAWTMVRYGEGTPLPVDGPRKLVGCGPYRLVRNPMALAGLGQGIAVSLWHGSWLLLGFYLAGAAGWHAFIRPAEERHLEATFGGEYQGYKVMTGLWFPRLRM